MWVSFGWKVFGKKEVVSPQGGNSDQLVGYPPGGYFSGKVTGFDKGLLNRQDGKGILLGRAVHTKVLSNQKIYLFQRLKSYN